MAIDGLALLPDCCSLHVGLVPSIKFILPKLLLSHFPRHIALCRNWALDGGLALDPLDATQHTGFPGRPWECPKCPQLSWGWRAQWT